MVRQTGAQFLIVPGPDPWRGFDYVRDGRATSSLDASRTVLQVARGREFGLGDRAPPGVATIAQTSVPDTSWPERRALDLLHVGHDGGSEGRDAHATRPSPPRRAG